MHLKPLSLHQFSQRIETMRFASVTIDLRFCAKRRLPGGLFLRLRKWAVIAEKPLNIKIDANKEPYEKQTLESFRVSVTYVHLPGRSQPLRSGARHRGLGTASAQRVADGHRDL